MSIKNFLSYLFKDNDPITTDLFDANWGNGVTAHLNSLLRAPHITIPSDDRQAQLLLEGSNYYIGADGKDLGYPVNYLTLINMKRDDNLVVQLVYSHAGIWTRTVDHTNSNLEWGLKAPTPITYGITQGNGVTSLARNKITKTGTLVVVEIAGTFTSGTGNKVVGTLPLDVVPERALRAIGVALTTSSTYGAQQFIINQGTREIIAENIPSTAAGGAFQLNISYTI
ncbi:hypothetical protein [Erysipelothrix anatis]|uniref:hypothetical protein n=1 Tax=Erysipelothrix anatis TaxID=2683713 RepID=UPI00140DE734|nr:hypothetical protein [Erysipelothrix anatis]